MHPHVVILYNNSPFKALLAASLIPLRLFDGVSACLLLRPKKVTFAMNNPNWGGSSFTKWRVIYRKLRVMHSILRNLIYFSDNSPLSSKIEHIQSWFHQFFVVKLFNSFFFGLHCEFTHESESIDVAEQSMRFDSTIGHLIKAISTRIEVKDFFFSDASNQNKHFCCVKLLELQIFTIKNTLNLINYLFWSNWGLFKRLFRENWFFYWIKFP